MTRFCLSLLVALTLVACDSDPDPVDAGGGRDSGSATDAGGTRDAGGSMDAGPGPTDAGPTDAGPGPTDSGSPTASDAAVGDSCLFNFQCAADQACTDCTVDSCMCEVAARGAGGVGAACTDNADCANGNCLTVNGTSACTMPCAAEGAGTSDCGGMFPDCGPVPFIGFDNVCIAADEE